MPHAFQHARTLKILTVMCVGRMAAGYSYTRTTHARAPEDGMWRPKWWRNEKPVTYAFPPWYGENAEEEEDAAAALSQDTMKVARPSSH